MSEFDLADFVPATEIPRITTRLEDAYKIELEILALQDKITDLQNRKMTIIEEHVNAGETVEGPFSITKKVTKRATLDADKFFETYPDQFASLWQELGQSKFKPSKAEAAKVLTSHQIEKICKHSESVSYSVDWDMHAEAEL